MYDLFGKLETPRKRVIAKRQLEILKILLEIDKIDATELYKRVLINYSKLKNPINAVARDLQGLIKLGAIDFIKLTDKDIEVRCRLDWPKEITESEFMKKIRSLPKAIS